MNETSETNAETNATAQAAAGTEAEAQVKVVSCITCEGPVASTASKCFACGSPLTGKEFVYISRQAAAPDIGGMIKWWAIWSVVVLALGGFSFGIGSSIGFTAVTLVYLVRILRAYYR
ncbi:MAG: hypothetical protein ABJ308_00440 [Halieaceae bacterium]